MGVTIQYANSALLIVWGIILYHNNRSINYRIKTICSFFGAFAVLIVSQSRTFLLGSILAVASYSLTSVKKIGYAIVIFSSVLVIFTGIVVTDLASGLKSKFTSDLSVKAEQLRSDDIDVVSAGRISMWAGALEEFKTNPFVGVGLGNALRKYPAYNDVIPRPHNLYIQILAELGILGLIIFIVLLAKTFRNLYALKKINAASADYLMWGLILFLFSNIFKADWGLTFLLIILTERLFYIERQERLYATSINYCSDI
jgi:O-antigen ligase